VSRVIANIGYRALKRLRINSRKTLEELMHGPRLDRETLGFSEHSPSRPANRLFYQIFCFLQFRKKRLNITLGAIETSVKRFFVAIVNRFHVALPIENYVVDFSHVGPFSSASAG
jgi:hypothetical protein